MLRHLNINSIRLMTNNPKKIDDMKLFTNATVTQELMPDFCHEDNQSYLKTKKTKLQHGIYSEDEE
jgi:GTP cyclohydrolase II